MSNRTTELAKNTGIYAIGVFGTKLITFILVPVYSYYLTKDNLGLYDVILTGLLLISPVVSMQLSESTFRWLIEKEDENEINTILKTSSYVTFLLIVFGFIITALICQIAGRLDMLWIYALVVTNILFIYTQQISRGLKRSKTYVKGVILNSILLLSISMLSLTYIAQTVDTLLISMLISTGCSAIYFTADLRLLQRSFKSSVDMQLAKEMVSYSMPLIPNAASWWLVSAANRMIVLYYLGVDSNGIFAISARIPGILTIVNSIFMLAWQDSVLSEHSAAKSYKSEMLRKFIIFETCVIVIVIFSSQYLTKYLIHEDYYESWNFMPLLVVGTSFAALSAFLGVNFLKTKQTTTLFTTTLSGGVINVILSVALIKHIGLYAPALGTMFGFATAFLLRSISKVTKEALEIPYRKIFAFLIIAISSVYLASIELWYINLFGGLIALAYLLTEFAPFLVGIYKKLARNFKTN